MIESIHNKKEYPPMHTAEHILNKTMVDMFGCSRSHNAHVERKKSKCDYYINEAPSQETIEAVEAKVNEVIDRNLEVTVEVIAIEKAKLLVDLKKMPEGEYNNVRLVRIGDYDICACAGAHVKNTSLIGKFKIISFDYNNDKKVLRLRFKLIDSPYKEIEG